MRISILAGSVVVPLVLRLVELTTTNAGCLMMVKDEGEWYTLVVVCFLGFHHCSFAFFIGSNGGGDV